MYEAEKQALQQRSLEVLAEIAKIKDAITRAKEVRHATGKYPDKDWYFRAKRALDEKQILHQLLLKEIGKASQAEKQLRISISEKRAAIYERNFIKAARQMLDDATYESLVREARLHTDN